MYILFTITLLLLMVSWPQEEWDSFDWTVRRAGWGRGGNSYAPGTLRRPVISVEAPMCSEEGPWHSQINLTPSLDPGLSLAQKTCWMNAWIHESVKEKTQHFHNPIFQHCLLMSWPNCGISLLKILLVLMGHYKSFRICYNHIRVLLVLTISQEEEFVLGAWELKKILSV